MYVCMCVCAQQAKQTTLNIDANQIITCPALSRWAVKTETFIMNSPPWVPKLYQYIIKMLQTCEDNVQCAKLKHTEGERETKNKNNNQRKRSANKRRQIRKHWRPRTQPPAAADAGGPRQTKTQRRCTPNGLPLQTEPPNWGPLQAQKQTQSKRAETRPPE